MCVYDEHPLASQDTLPSNQELAEYRATKCWLNTEQTRAGQNTQ